MMNSTDRICNALEAKATMELRDRLTSAYVAYNNALGLGGTCEWITLKDGSGNSLKIVTTDIFKQITEQLTAMRKEKACADEVRSFLAGVQGIQQQFNGLEQYLENN